MVCNQAQNGEEIHTSRIMDRLRLPSGGAFTDLKPPDKVALGAVCSMGARSNTAIDEVFWLVRSSMDEQDRFLEDVFRREGT